MSIPFEPVPSNTPHPAGRGDTNVVAQILAFLCGLFLLLVGSVMSLGMVLVGAAGMGIATLAQHQRRRPLTRFGGWLAALISVGVVCAVIAFVVSLEVPPNTWSQMKVAMDSASAASAKQPPPAWVERMYPGASQRASARRQVFSGKAQSAFLAATFGFMAFFVVGIYGSFGWAVGMLLGYGVRGRWPGTAVLPLPAAF